jgi:hypothetical protein
LAGAASGFAATAFGMSAFIFVPQKLMWNKQCIQYILSREM